MTKYGLIEKVPDLALFGVARQLPRIVLQADRDWTPCLPAKELQHIPAYDTFGCVSFSRNNCYEIQLKRTKNIEINISDRYTVVTSGTIPWVGNYLDKVGDNPDTFGVVTEDIYPFAGKTVEEYYQPVPESIIAEGRKSILQFTFAREWVDWGGCDPFNLWEHLQYAPLQVTVHAWKRPVDGVYQRTMEETNHAVTLFKGEYMKFWWIYDHYDNVIKKLAWDFNFGSAMRHNIEVRMLKLLKGDQRPEIYAVGVDGVLHHIAGQESFFEGQRAGLWGEWNTWEVQPQVEVDYRTKGRAFGFIN